MDELSSGLRLGEQTVTDETWTDEFRRTFHEADLLRRREVAAEIAVAGGAGVHPELTFVFEAPDLAGDGPAVAVMQEYGNATWLPLWSENHTTTTFSLADGRFVRWHVESYEPGDVWPDYPTAVASTLDEWELPTDLTRHLEALFGIA